MALHWNVKNCAHSSCWDSEGNMTTTCEAMIWATMVVGINEITEKTVHADTVYANGSEMPVKTDKVSKVLPDNTYWAIVALIFVQIVLVTMVYGPIAAFLVEIFPTKIRYTSMSLPYHLGNGVFGGLTPFIAVLLGTMYTGDKLVGLWYPIGVSLVCLVIGVIYLSNRIDPDVKD